MALAFLAAIFLAGCPSGGGSSGGGTTPDPVVNPIHTQFNVSAAFIAELNRSYSLSTTFYETRGDEIQINKMKTFRTLTMTGNYDTEQSPNYEGGPRQIYGYDLIKGSSALVTNSSSVGYTPNYYLLKGYESRTISTTIMVGATDSAPNGFNGLFIRNSEFRNWKSQNKTGVKFWVLLEGYDNKLKDTYNIFIPLEVVFSSALSDNNTNPFDPANPGGGNTNPYDPFSPSIK